MLPEFESLPVSGPSRQTLIQIQVLEILRVGILSLPTQLAGWQ
jgi:hypothetical protein